MASQGCRATPARPSLLTGIVPEKFCSLAGFFLGERSSAPDDELISELSLPPYIWLRGQGVGPSD